MGGPPPGPPGGPPQGPPPGWGPQPRQPNYAPPMWGPPPPPPPETTPQPPDGITAAGIPWSQRGRVGLDTAACLDVNGRECGASVNLLTDIPVTDNLFVEGVVPLGVGGANQAALGNPTLGVHYVGRLMKKMWLTGGGSLGFPLIDESTLLVGSLPRALWDFHLYHRRIVPLTLGLDWEMHASFVEVRVELSPSILFPLAGEDFGGGFYHAAEVQFGHGIGGGLRLQGVVAATPEFSDKYAAALAPFFVLKRDAGYMRVAIVMPLNEPYGPPFDSTWGFNFGAGIHID
ncbi:MAG: hypothetical protein R3B72_16025 [Polyangiaceae bacterium]